VISILTGLLGAAWRACVQHQTPLIEAWGLPDLASADARPDRPQADDL